MSLSIPLSPEYGTVVFTSVAIIFECFFLSVLVGGARRKAFPKEFLEKHFGEEHKKYFKEPIAKGGYPDCGDGLYSDKLSYKDWYEFNNAQRTHLNFVESIFIIIPLVLAAGYVYPSQATNAGVAYFIGRLIYAVGYRIMGPKGRLIGAGLNFFSMLALVVMVGCIVYKNLDLSSPFEYPLVVLSALLILGQTTLASGGVYNLRKKYFNLERLNKSFGRDHNEAFGSEITHAGGYPDMGHGRYAKMLNYEEWFNFAKAQRAHLNGVENVGLTIPLLFIAGTYCSCYAGSLGLVYFVGRMLYTYGYNRYGPKGRLAGIALAELSMLALLVFAGIAGYNLAFKK